MILEHKWDLSVAYTYRDVSIWISAFGVSISEMQIDLLERSMLPFACCCDPAREGDINKAL